LTKAVFFLPFFDFLLSCRLLSLFPFPFFSEVIDIKEYPFSPSSFPCFWLFSLLSLLRIGLKGGRLFSSLSFAWRLPPFFFFSFLRRAWQWTSIFPFSLSGSFQETLFLSFLPKAARSKGKFTLPFPLFSFFFSFQSILIPLFFFPPPLNAENGVG